MVATAVFGVLWLGKSWIELRQRTSRVTASKLSKRVFKHLENGALDDAIAVCDEIIRLTPGDYVPYRWRAAAHIRKGDHDAAIADCNRGLEIAGYPDFMLIRYRGSAYHRKGEFTKAIDDFNLNLQDGGLDEDYRCRGATYHAMGEFQKALADFDKAIEFKVRNLASDKIEPWFDGSRWQYARLYRSRAIVKQDMGELLDALEDFDTAIEFDPENSQLRVEREALVDQMHGLAADGQER